jgi:enamine deaminase RidA (YjgF/YER057c/UK114 family)
MHLLHDEFFQSEAQLDSMAHTQTQRHRNRTGNDGHQQLGDTPPGAQPAISVRNVTAEELRELVATEAERLFFVVGFDADMTSATPPQVLSQLANPLACGYAHVPIATLATRGRIAPYEAWMAPTPVTRDVLHGVNIARTDDLLFGCVSVTQADDVSLEDVTRVAYCRIFDCIDAAGMPYLNRAWHYLPAINSPEQSMERYRRFSVGRHDAFVEKGRTIERDAPAASALGSPQTAANASLVIYFAATKTRGTPLENPRQVSAYRYPKDYGPRSPTFARALLAPPSQGIFYVSGTASIVGHETKHVGDVIAQTHETLANIRALQDEATRQGANHHARTTHVKVYVRNAGDSEIVHELVEAALVNEAADNVEIIYMEADICRSDLLIEIELLTHLEVHA